MNEIINYLDEIKNYCDFNIEYDITNKLYKFNEQYIDDIKFEDFNSKVEHLKEDLLSILKVSDKLIPLIDDVLNEIKEILNWYDQESIGKFSNFEKINYLSVQIENYPVINKTNKYTVESINNLDSELDHKYEELLYYIVSKKSFANNYSNPLDLEKVQLHFTFLKFYESISNFENFLLNLKENFNKYGYHELEDKFPSEYRHRCTVNFNKIEASHFFNALFESGLFYFPQYKGDNSKKKIKQFIEDNFNYTDKRHYNNIEKITYVGKEFTYIGGSKRTEKNKSIINTIIDTLEDIKLKM